MASKKIIDLDPLVTQQLGDLREVSDPNGLLPSNKETRQQELNFIQSNIAGAPYTAGDLIYADSTTTLSKIPDAVIGNVLLSGGVGAAPAYGKVDLTSAVSNILPTSNGGTGQSVYTDGELLIGKTDGTLSKSTLTAGSGISIVNSDGEVTVNATGDVNVEYQDVYNNTVATSGDANTDISAGFPFTISSTEEISKPIPSMTLAQSAAVANPINGGQAWVSDDNRVYSNRGTPGAPDFEAHAYLSDIVGSGGLLAANNLSDVANKFTSSRNLGLTQGPDIINDNLDRVYTTSTQPSAISAFYAESGHTVKLCPFDEVASPTAGSFFCTIGCFGASSFDLYDADDVLVQTIYPGESFLVAALNQTSAGIIQLLPITLYVNNESLNFQSYPSIDLRSAYSESTNAGLTFESGENLTFYNHDAALNSISSTPSDSSTAPQDGARGCMFQHASMIKITALMVWDDHFLAGPASRTCAIYDYATENLLASVDVLKTDALESGFRVHYLDVPIYIPAATNAVAMQRYYTADFYSGVSTPGSGLTISQGAYADNTVGIQFPTTFDGVANTVYAGFFKYEVVNNISQVSGNGQILSRNLSGSFATPSFAGMVDATTGFDVVSPGFLRITTGGASRFEINTSSIASKLSIDMMGYSIFNVGNINSTLTAASISSTSGLTSPVILHQSSQRITNSVTTIITVSYTATSVAQSIFFSLPYTVNNFTSNLQASGTGSASKAASTAVWEGKVLRAVTIIGAQTVRADILTVDNSSDYWATIVISYDIV